MYALSDQQIDFILNDIKLREVEMEDLQLNLLDHVCCIIECELEQEGDFDSFYQKTISKFFKKELKEIEEETKLLLTFKHYYAMKKTMNTLGIIASIGIVLGAIFRFAHLPGANVMLILGVVLISFVFLPLMFTLKLRESSEKRDRVILILGCVISILFVIAAAFKLMHWPGANVLMGSAVLGLLFIFVPVYLFTGLRNPVTKVNTLVNSILIIAGSGLIMSLSTNGGGVPHAIVKGIVDVHERLLENTKKVNQSNALVLQSLSSDKLPADVNYYLVTSKSTREYIETLRTNLVMTAERVTADEAKAMKVEEIRTIGNEVIGTYYMLGTDLTGESGNVKELKEKVASLNSTLSKLKDAQKQSWSLNASVENEQFKYVPVGFVLQEFAELEYELANAERQVLNYYSAKL
ncbi:MAG: hypothetical protein V4608_05500 [Bacteroidota bacterium]